MPHPEYDNCARQNQQAFSLLQFSLALVCVGLVTGGFFIARSMRHASQLRQVSAQFQHYLTATQQFRDKYHELPGDMTNAIAYWGIAASTSNCATAASRNQLTCNGDGNGRINVSDSSNESYRFWQHLANEGLIEGRYDGIAHGVTNYASNTLNSPAGALPASLWFVSDRGSLQGLNYAFDGDYGNVLELGGIFTDNEPAKPILTPIEAYNIDNKLDDGKPATGTVVVRAQNGFATCTDGAESNALTASYKLNINAVSCGLYFRQLFNAPVAALAQG